MATPTAQALADAIDLELLARIEGRSIPEYTMPDGRSIRKIESSELRQLGAHYRAQANRDSATAVTGGRAYAIFGRPR